MTPNPSPFPSPQRDCVATSLRGREATEAISQGIDISELPRSPSVARNDKEESRLEGLILNSFLSWKGFLHLGASPAVEEMVIEPEKVEDLSDGMVDEIVNRFRAKVESGNGGSKTAPIRLAWSIN